MDQLGMVQPGMNKRLSTNPVHATAFWTLIVICIWSPLPLGSNREWAWGITCAAIFILSTGCLLAIYKHKLRLPPALVQARYAAGILALVPLWAFLQAVPLPDTVLAWLAPKSLAIFNANQQTAAGAISLDRQASIDWGIRASGLWLMFVLSLLLIQTSRQLKIWMLVIAGCGVFQALYGSYMLLSGENMLLFQEKTAHLNKASGTFVNPNHFAGYLEMALAVGLGLLLSRLQLRNGQNWREMIISILRSMLDHKVALRLLLVIMVLGLILSRSRMGNLAFFISLTSTMMMFIYFTRWRTQENGYSARLLYLLLASIVAVDLLAMGAVFGGKELAQRVSDTQLQQETRLTVSSDTMSAIQDFALIGAGAGGFSSLYPGYRSAEVDLFYDHAHNDYLQFGLELGIPATLLLAVFVILALRQAIQTLQQRRHTLMTGAAFACIMSVIAIAIHSTADFNLQIPANSLLFVQCLALGWLASTLDRQPEHD